MTPIYKLHQNYLIALCWQTVASLCEQTAVHPILPVVQLQTRRCGETLACPLPLGRSLLVRDHGLCYLWRIHSLSGSDVLSKVTINNAWLPSSPYYSCHHVSGALTGSTQASLAWWEPRPSGAASWRASRSPAWCRWSSPPPPSTGSSRHSGQLTIRTSFISIWLSAFCINCSIISNLLLLLVMLVLSDHDCLFKYPKAF